MQNIPHLPSVLTMAESLVKRITGTEQFIHQHKPRINPSHFGYIPLSVPRTLPSTIQGLVQAENTTFSGRSWLFVHVYLVKLIKKATPGITGKEVVHIISNLFQCHLIAFDGAFGTHQLKGYVTMVLKITLLNRSIISQRINSNSKLKSTQLL